MNQRVQVGDLQQSEDLQVTVNPRISTANAPQGPRLEDNNAYRLSKALGVASEKLPDALEDQTKAEAEAFFNSKTVDEIGKMTRSGELAAQHNPLFVGMVNNLYGQNQMQQQMRDTETRLKNGELTFKTAEELDAYMVSQRNELLAQHPDNKYVQNGFDSQFNAYRNQIKNNYTQLASKAMVDNAGAQVTDALYNKSQSILNPANKLSPEDSISQWMSQYNLMKSTVLLDPEARKDALYSNAKTFAVAGRPDLVRALMDYQLDNGVTVRGAMGNDKAEALVAAADSQYTQMQNEMRKAQILATQNAQLSNVSSSIDLAIDTDQLGFVPETYQTLNDSGELTTKPTEDLKLQRMAEKTQNLSFPEKVNVYARNNLNNPEWKNQVGAAAANIYTVGVPVNDKGEVGVLSDVGKAGFDTFATMYRISPDYAKKNTPTSSDFDTLETMYLAIQNGVAKDAQEAAWGMNQKSRLGIKQVDYDSMVQDIKNKTANLSSGAWYDPFNMFNTEAQENQTAVASQVRNVATYLINSGQASNADTAVEKAQEIINASSIKFNGGRYLRSQVPTFSPGVPTDIAMSEYMKDVFEPRLKNAAPYYSRLDWDDVYYLPTETGFQVKRKDGITPVLANGQPMTITFKEMESWVANQQKDVNSKLSNETAYRNFQTRFNAANMTSPYVAGKIGAGLGESPFVIAPSREEFQKIRGVKVMDRKGNEVLLQDQSPEVINKWLKENNGN